MSNINRNKHLHHWECSVPCSSLKFTLLGLEYQLLRLQRVKWVCGFSLHAGLFQSHLAPVALLRH